MLGPTCALWIRCQRYNRPSLMTRPPGAQLDPDLGRRCPPAGIPRPVRFGGHTEQGGECRLRLAQRDPALTQRARLHDVTPCYVNAD